MSFLERVLSVHSHLFPRTHIQCPVARDFMGRWMPEANETFEVFLGEFYWSSAYNFHRRSATGYEEWSTARKNDQSFELAVTTDGYAHERGHDCSVEDSVRVNAPSKRLAEKMGLCWRGIEGEFCDGENNLIAYDPSVFESGPGTLLINRQTFLRFLNEHDLEIVWTLLGEKMAIGSSSTPNEWQWISGVYRFVDDKLVGTVTAKYHNNNSKAE